MANETLIQQSPLCGWNLQHVKNNEIKYSAWPTFFKNNHQTEYVTLFDARTTKLTRRPVFIWSWEKQLCRLICSAPLSHVLYPQILPLFLVCVKLSSVLPHVAQTSFWLFKPVVNLIHWKRLSPISRAQLHCPSASVTSDEQSSLCRQLGGSALQGCVPHYCNAHSSGWAQQTALAASAPAAQLPVPLF